MEHVNEICETVTVEGPKGQPMRINKSDYDEKKHKIVKVKDAPKPAETGGDSDIDPETMDVKQLKAALDERGVGYDAKARKDDLVELLQASLGQ